jgi:hypothetical protein
MAKQRDLKKHFEAILGRELAGGFGGEVALRETVGLSVVQEDGATTTREIGVTGNSAMRCGKTRLLTVAGLSFVGSEGKATLRLSDFHCRGPSYLDPAFVVATPNMPSSIFVTAIPAIIDNGLDVQIVLHTWAAGGDPAPNVLVSWCCRVQWTPTIF